MADQRAPKRQIHGIVLLDKPAGQTSNRALQTVKRIFRAAKAGHTGSLDPFATGMLPICLGKATRVSAGLLDASKEYAVEVELGRATDTGDPDGRIVAEQSLHPRDRSAIDHVLQGFVGAGMQVPPMYSALKRDGRRLYELAREGIDVERAPRPYRIDWIRLQDIEWPRFRFEVRCSKGTYVRSLAIDIAERLGTIAHVTVLRRLAVDPFERGSMVSLETLTAAAARSDAVLDALLLPPDTVLQSYPRVDVGSGEVDALTHGQAVPIEVPGPGLVRIYGPDGRFVGLGEGVVGGRLQPRRIFLG